MLWRNSRLFFAFLLWNILAIAAWASSGMIANIIAPAMAGPMLADMMRILIPMFHVFMVMIVLLLLGTPPGAIQISDNLHRAGVVNGVDEPPMLIARYPYPGNYNVEILEFIGVGIPITKYEDKKPGIQTALNCFVDMIREGPAPNRVLLYTVPYNVLPDKIAWSEDHAIHDNGSLNLGVSITGTDVRVDLYSTPHILIGGSTGSGKSILLKLLLKQCMDKGMDVFIADFKGGVDYGRKWEERCTLVLTLDALLELLDKIVNELERRKILLRNECVVNIDEFNTTHAEKLVRIVFACDEVAELLDKTGASKELKADIDRVVNNLSTIARQGRAFGIHLILATQRPDANILPGQIKNNIDVRACGRADNVLSQIILDSTDAADLIPKDSHKFLLYDGTIFQPYMLEEEI